MPALNQNLIENLYSNLLGRDATPSEIAQWKSVDVPKDDQYSYLASKLRGTPEYQTFQQTKQTWTPFGVNQGGANGVETSTPPQTNTSPTPVYQGGYFSSSTPVGSTQTFATNYQPLISQQGTVLPFVPAGMSYTPPNYALPQGTYQDLPFQNPGGISITGENGFPSFSFDFAAEQRKAYEELRPFYEKLLSFAGGDLDLAQRIIEYTYQQGMRESKSLYEQEQKEFDLTFPTETSQQKTAQNRRGVLTSGFGQTERQRLQESQALRREASERALSDRESRLISQRGFGLEEKQQGFQREAFDLERERRKEASGMATDKFNIKSTQYQGDLARAQREEQRRIQNEQTEMQKKLYQQQGYNV